MKLNTKNTFVGMTILLTLLIVLGFLAVINMALVIIFVSILMSAVLITFIVDAIKGKKHTINEILKLIGGCAFCIGLFYRTFLEKSSDNKISSLALALSTFLLLIGIYIERRNRKNKTTDLK
jgi:hypothetical protein